MKSAGEPSKLFVRDKCLKLGSSSENQPTAAQFGLLPDMKNTQQTLLKL
jgi:hypothetical protein